jgi:hypothetical protein
VDQPGGAEGVIRTLAPELPVGDASQIVVHGGIEAVTGTGIAAAHGQQKFGDRFMTSHRQAAGAGVVGVRALPNLKMHLGLMVRKRKAPDPGSMCGPAERE